MSDAPAAHRVVCLLDVDNTLLDNDTVTSELQAYLTKELGALRQEEYWRILEDLRTQLGYTDYLGALQRYRLAHPRDPHMLYLSAFLIDYPFADRLYPGALDVIRHCSQDGPTVILTDGDAVFQPRKVARAGLGAAVQQRVLIYVHKEQELEDVEQRFPANHYIFVDDKVRLLTAFKAVWGHRVTTVFPRQGHYAHAPDVANYPAPDLTITAIRDLLDWELPALVRRAGAEPPV